jgi:hypothetical protein
MFADISKLNMSTFGVVLVATTIIEVIMLFMIRYNTQMAGENINIYYNKFGLDAVLADIGIIVLGIALTQLIYRNTFFPSFGWHIRLFILMLVVFQLIHDTLLYLLVITPIPEGHNSLIDLLKSYGRSGGFLILFYDACMLIGTVLIASVLYTYPVPVSIIAGTLAAYTIPYILATQNEYSGVTQSKN